MIFCSHLFTEVIKLSHQVLRTSYQDESMIQLIKTCHQVQSSRQEIKTKIPIQLAQPHHGILRPSLKKPTLKPSHGTQPWDSSSAGVNILRKSENSSCTVFSETLPTKNLAVLSNFRYHSMVIF